MSDPSTLDVTTCSHGKRHGTDRRRSQWGEGGRTAARARVCEAKGPSRKLGRRGRCTLLIWAQRPAMAAAPPSSRSPGPRPGSRPLRILPRVAPEAAVRRRARPRPPAEPGSSCPARHPAGHGCAANVEASDSRGGRESLQLWPSSDSAGGRCGTLGAISSARLRLKTLTLRCMPAPLAGGRLSPPASRQRLARQGVSGPKAGSDHESRAHASMPQRPNCSPCGLDSTSADATG